MIRKITAAAALFALAFSIVPLAAEEGSSGITSSTSLGFVAATTLEAKVKLVQSYKIPFLAGGNALTSGNNVNLKGAFELSPVSVNGTFDVAVTPIAFLVFSAGAGVGSGWNIPIANGLRTNEPAKDANGVLTGKRELTGAAFDGAVWYGKAGATFQFDFAAIVPGDWNHVVFQTYHEAKYRALTSAGSDDSWLYEADSGENRNGLNYYGNYVLGYQMPIRLNMVALLVEEDLYLYDTDNRANWGDDLGRWNIGGIFNFQATEKLSLALIVQMSTYRKFKDSTGDNEFYQSRVIADSDPLGLKFYRAAINGTYVLK